MQLSVQQLEVPECKTNEVHFGFNARAPMCQEIIRTGPLELKFTVGGEAMVKAYFHEAKATQLAALLIRHRGVGRMNFLKLIKLMYLVDREALRRWGRTVSTDHHVSMDKGPVLSNVYSLISEEPSDKAFWNRHIGRCADYDVRLLADPGDNELSRAEEELIAEVFAAHGHKNRFQLVRELHEVPEWQDPNGSMIPIQLRDILRAVGRDEDDIAAIEEQTDAEVLASHLFEPV